MFIYPAIKCYKEIWRVETRLRSGRLKSMRVEGAIKSVREQIRSNPLWKQKIMSRKLNISTQSRRASSGTMFTWERTSSQRDASLLLLWRKSEGQEQSVSLSGTSGTGMKISSPRTRKPSPSISSITTSTTRFMLKRPLRCLLRVRGAITLPTSWFGRWCPISGWHLFIFARKVWKPVPEYIKRMCYKEMWYLLTQLSSMVRNGSSSRTQLRPTRPRQLRSGCEGTFRHLSAPKIGPRGIQTSTPWIKICRLFFLGHGLPKAS